jgi:uncharacterized protein YbjQ (UPF0145 family)
MALKLRTKTSFPALVTATSPMTLTKSGLEYIFGMDLTDLGDAVSFNTVSVVDAGRVQWAPLGDNSAPFHIAADLALDGTDPHFYMGYNLNPRTWALSNPADRGLIYGIEADYAEPGIAPHHAMEWYVQYQKTSGFGGGGTSTYIRQIMGQIDKTTHLPTILRFAAAGIGYKWGWLDGTGTEAEEQVCGKDKMTLTNSVLQVYNVPGDGNPILTLDSETAYPNSQTGLFVSSRVQNGGVHLSVSSPNVADAIYLNGKGTGGIIFNSDDGRGVLFKDGTAANPEITFISDQNTGFYRIGADNIGVSVGGSTVLDIGTGGMTVVGRSFATSGIGIPTGAGGGVIQATSKSTSVTLNKASGEITMNGAALAAGAVVGFTFNNSLIGATDLLLVNITNGTGGAYSIDAKCVSGGSSIYLRNLTAGSLSEALVLRFVLIKGANS